MFSVDLFIIFLQQTLAVENDKSLNDRCPGHLSPLFSKSSGVRLNIKMSSYRYRDPHVKDKSRGRLIFNMEIPIPTKTVFILRRGPVSYSLPD